MSAFPGGARGDDCRRAGADRLGSATHTEILFALGAGGRVVAVDLFSDYPAETADKQPSTHSTSIWRR